MNETDNGAVAGLPVPSPDSDVAARPGRRRPDVNAPVRRKARVPLPEFTGLPTHYSDADVRFYDFLPPALQVVYTPPSRWRSAIAYAICGVITAAILWSIFGHMRMFAIANGVLEARGGSQTVEPVESGQISEVPVQNGSHVEKGRIVLQIDPTAARAALTIVEAKLANARAEAIRCATATRRAEAPQIDKETPITWPSDLPADVEAREDSVLLGSLAQLAATIADLQSKLKTEQAIAEKFTANIAAQKTLIESRTKRTAMHETLAQQGWDSRAMVLQSLEPLRQDQVNLADYEGSLKETHATIAVIEMQLAQARKSFIADNVDAGAAAERLTADLRQQLKKANRALADLSMRAPATGTVQGLAVTSVGQSVKVGEKLLQIVPDGAPLEIKAYVLNSDIGFVKTGQPVVIKVDTFPYTRYGTIEGRVVNVGADAITGKYAAIQQKDDATTPTKGVLSVTKAAQQMKDLVFPVTVVPDKSSIRVDGRDVPLTSGMSVVVEIETLRQRAIKYILYPLTRVFYSGKARD